MKKSSLVLASNLPGERKPTPVIGARMQKFCNCDPVRNDGLLKPGQADVPVKPA